MLALHRLPRHGLVAHPAHGFYVIVPPEYRQLGCLPAGQFIPALMEQLGLGYYVGLLSPQYLYRTTPLARFDSAQMARHRKPGAGQAQRGAGQYTVQAVEQTRAAQLERALIGAR